MPSTLCHKHILGAGLLGVLLGFGPIGTGDAAGPASLPARATPVNTIGDLQTRYGRPQLKLFLPS